MDNQKQFDRINDKLDEIIENQHTFEMKMTKRVGRNTLLINAALWIVCAVVGAGIVSLFTLL